MAHLSSETIIQNCVLNFASPGMVIRVRNSHVAVDIAQSQRSIKLPFRAGEIVIGRLLKTYTFPRPCWSVTSHLDFLKG